MTAEGARQVHSCEELSVGDQIEAWHNGKLFHRGTVARTVAATGLFWIMDERTGGRRLIDAEALVILRVAVPAAPHGSTARSAVVGSPPRVTPAPAAPASHVPLFQAPAGCPDAGGSGPGPAR
ncbi:MAG: hypothetical protein ABWX85_07645 [Arthrobacter sp.]